MRYALVEWRFDVTEELKLKGLRATIIGGAITVVGTFGAALVNYVVEHGELPQWSSGALSWLSSLMLIQAPWAFWEILVIFLTPSMAFGLMIVHLWRTYSTLVDDYNEQCDRLELANAAKERLERDDVKLKAINAALLDENNSLKAKIHSESHSQTELAERHFSVLLSVAECENAGVVTTIENLSVRSDLQKVALSSTLDDLIASGYIQRISMAYKYKYQLTPSGRKLVLKVGPL